MGLLLIKGGTVAAPQLIGKKDILAAENNILAIEDEISEAYVRALDPEAEIINADSCLVVPGLVDGHIHFNGAGGENGPQFRTPPVQFSSFVKAGITTAIAPLGTDGICRSLRELLAKSRSLDSEGITTFIFTGAYSLPSVTITDNMQTDIVLIDKIIGTKIALADHRSSHPSVEELRRIISNTRVAGIIAGKAGVVEIHMGSEKDGLKFICEAVEGTDVPRTQVIPTHINRCEELFASSLKYCAEGGIADMTTGMGSEAVPVTESVDRILAAGGDKLLAQYSLSTDGNGSMPVFNEAGDFVRMGVGDPSLLISSLRDIITQTKADLTQALSLVTANPAKRLKLFRKGKIEKNTDADILVLSQDDYSLQYVIAKGKPLMKAGKVVKFGTFENPENC